MKKVLFIATDGVEQVELTTPWQELEKAGYEPSLASSGKDSIQGMNHDEKGDKFIVDSDIDDIDADEYAALVLPGGVANPDHLREDEKIIMFIQDFAQTQKPVAAICHAPWLLVEAECVDGREITSYPSLRKDLENAGANWVDKEVVVSDNFITSRNPDDLPAFCSKIIEKLGD